MTLHHVMELAVAGVVSVGKMLGSILGEMVGDSIAEARARTPDRAEPVPHVLKLPEAPTPPSGDWTRSPAGPGDGACPPPRRSTGG